MSQYEDMKRLFHGEGLGLPPVPPALRPEIREIRPWTYATFDIDWFDLYKIENGVRTTLSRRNQDSFAVGHVGHGVNSYAIGCQVVWGSFIVALQLAWGGIYMDNESAADAVRRSFDAVGSLLSLQAPAEASDGHVLVISADLVELQAFGWLSLGEEVDLREWAKLHAATDPMDTARTWALENGWTPRQRDDQAYDRFVWREGDVVFLSKDRSGEDPRSER